MVEACFLSAERRKSLALTWKDIVATPEDTVVLLCADKARMGRRAGRMGNNLNLRC